MHFFTTRVHNRAQHVNYYRQAFLQECLLFSFPRAPQSATDLPPWSPTFCFIVLVLTLLKYKTTLILMQSSVLNAGTSLTVVSLETQLLVTKDKSMFWVCINITILSTFYDTGSFSFPHNVYNDNMACVPGRWQRFTLTNTNIWPVWYQQRGGVMICSNQLINSKLN